MPLPHREIYRHSSRAVHTSNLIKTDWSTNLVEMKSGLSKMKKKSFYLIVHCIYLVNTTAR